jgi:hypothetical protein
MQSFPWDRMCNVKINYLEPNISSSKGRPIHRWVMVLIFVLASLLLGVKTEFIWLVGDLCIHINIPSYSYSFKMSWLVQTAWASRWTLFQRVNFALIGTNEERRNMVKCEVFALANYMSWYETEVTCWNIKNATNLLTCVCSSKRFFRGRYQHFKDRYWSRYQEL